MKETKVYIDDELLIYDDFSLCCTKNFDNTFYTNNYSLIDNEEYFEAYFQKLKEILKRQIDIDSKEYLDSGIPIFKNYVAVENFILQKMQELEGEDVED